MSTDTDRHNLVSAARRMAGMVTADNWTPTYEPWRHGGWYVTNIVYPSGACGCVSRNYADRKWRIACDPRPFETAPTFRNRDEAARAERDLAIDMWITCTKGTAA